MKVQIEYMPDSGRWRMTGKDSRFGEVTASGFDFGSTFHAFQDQADEAWNIMAEKSRV
jgi:hypothetical protein